MFPNKNLYTRLLRYGIKNPNGFDSEKLKNDLKLNDDEIKIVDVFTSRAIMASSPMDNEYKPSNESNIFYSLRDRKDNNFIILTHEAFFNYQNYLNYKLGLIISIISILIAVIAIYFSTQQINISQKQLASPIKIEPSQIQEIKDLIKVEYFSVN